MSDWYVPVNYTAALCTCTRVHPFWLTVLPISPYEVPGMHYGTDIHTAQQLHVPLLSTVFKPRIPRIVNSPRTSDELVGEQHVRAPSYTCTYAVLLQRYVPPRTIIIVSIDPKFIELTADVLKISLQSNYRRYVFFHVNFFSRRSDHRQMICPHVVI